MTAISTKRLDSNKEIRSIEFIRSPSIETYVVHKISHAPDEIIIISFPIRFSLVGVINSYSKETLHTKRSNNFGSPPRTFYLCMSNLT